MSRVRNALKIAEVWQPQSPAPFQGRALPLARAPQALGEYADIGTHDEVDVELEEGAAGPSTLPKAPLSFAAQLLRRVKQLLGLRTGVVVPRCNGFTRNGIACRAPSMLNGYCRMHGGSRRLLG
jgi:hypothetical protein